LDERKMDFLPGPVPRGDYQELLFEKKEIEMLSVVVGGWRCGAELV
jgi:hypothetical protein